MKNMSRPFDDQVNPGLLEQIAKDLQRGVSRRNILRGLLASGILATTAGVLLTAATSLYAQSPRRGGRIKVASASSSSTDTLDPAKGSNSTDYTRAHMFYSGLTTLNELLVPQMALAESFATEGALLWTVKLRRDVRFHDGKPFTSADVIYSLTRHKKPETGSKALAVAMQFAEVKARGPHEVQIRLTTPNADLPVIFGTSHFLIVRDGTTDFSIANGTGPYKCVEFLPGVRSIGLRNKDYWKPDQPYLDEIELFSIPDAAARVKALLSGDVDVINSVDPRAVPRIIDAAGFSVQESQSGGYTDLVMRGELGPNHNPDFVLAMKYLLDREQIRKVAFRGFGTLANDQPLAPNHRYYFAGLPQRPFDPEKAKFHLQRSGLAGRTLPIVASTAADGSLEIAQLIQLSARQIGLKLDIKRVPADGYWSYHWMKHPLGFGNINPRPTADLMFSLFFKSDANWNESGWNNEQFDQLLIAARAETDESNRKQLYADMQVLIHERCGIGIPQFNSIIDAHNAKLKGYGANPLGGFMGFAFAEHVWLDS